LFPNGKKKKGEAHKAGASTVLQGTALRAENREERKGGAECTFRKPEKKSPHGREEGPTVCLPANSKVVFLNGRRKRPSWEESRTPERGGTNGRGNKKRGAPPVSGDRLMATGRLKPPVKDEKAPRSWERKKWRLAPSKTEE